ncbi:MAG: HAD-IA family hydrolase [Treponema sp.]
MMALCIKKLTPSLSGDFLSYFDNEAFLDHPEWAGCYCLESHLGDDAEKILDNKGLLSRRQHADELIRTGIMNGYLAYDNGKVVGWCNADDKRSYCRIADNPEYKTDGKIKAVYCFDIAPGYRGRGIAHKLLQQACEDAATEGYEFIEGYVHKNMSGIYQYHGPEALYIGNGFSPYREAKNIIIMRKTLPVIKQTAYEGIKGVFLDLGWTLEFPRNGDWMITEAFCQACSQPALSGLSPLELKAALSEGFNYLAKNHKVPSEEEEEKQFIHYYEIIGKALPQLGITYQKAADIAHDRTYNMQNYELIEGSRETLIKLKQNGFKLGIISDTWPSVRSQLAYFDIMQYFDSVTFSCDLGVFKPDPAMYKDALDKIKLPAEQTVFVDDMPYILEGAQKAGIKPIQSLQEPGKCRDLRFPFINRPADIPVLIC